MIPRAPDITHESEPLRSEPLRSEPRQSESPRSEPLRSEPRPAGALIRRDLLPASVGFAFVFALLFIAALPFPYHVVPAVGEYLSPFTESVIRSIAEAVLDIEGPYTASIVSDSTGMYVWALIAATVALLLCAPWALLDRRFRFSGRAWRLLHSAAAYYLALQLLRYGLDKIFKQQFYLPEPNTLHTPLGLLTRDILYWSTIGSSYSYNIVIGLAEVLPALLLLWRRTRVLGAIWAAAVMAHVVAVNFGFDISVKVYSCFLLWLCLLVAAPGLRSFWSLFVAGRRGEPYVPEKLWGARVPALYAFTKAVVIVLIAVEAMYVYAASGNFNGDAAQQPPLHGAYDVTAQESDGATPGRSASGQIRRVFVHSRGYFITQTHGDRFTDYRLAYDSPRRRLLLRSDSAAGVLDYDLAGGMLTLRGRLGGDSIVISARPVRLEHLPLLRGSFHWTIDEVR